MGGYYTDQARQERARLALIEQFRTATPEWRVAWFVARYARETSVSVERTIEWWDGAETHHEPRPPVVEVFAGDADSDKAATFQTRDQLEAFIAELRAAADEAWGPA